MPTNFLHGVEVVETTTGVRPIQTVRSAVIGVLGTAPNADASVFPLDTPVLISGSRTKAAKLGTSGTLPGAMTAIFNQIGATVVVVRIAEGADDAATLANAAGSASAGTGAWAFLASESAVGLSPKLICAPGFTHQATLTSGSEVANGVVAALASVSSGTTGVSDRLRAIVIADGPNTNATDAHAYADLHASSRIYVVDPWVKPSASTSVPGSAYVAGVVAKSDAERGFWHSPSNRIIQGIVGVTRPVGFYLGDENSEANLLNENDVATVIRENGFRLWGNHSTTSDQQMQYISTRRTVDMVNESVMRAHLWAVDKCITRTYLQDVRESVASYLRSLEARGAILGSAVTVDPEANTATDIANGQVTLDFEFTPAYPAERVRFRSVLSNRFIDTVLTDSTAEDESQNQPFAGNLPGNQSTAGQSGSGDTNL